MPFDPPRRVLEDRLRHRPLEPEAKKRAMRDFKRYFETICARVGRKETSVVQAIAAMDERVGKVGAARNLGVRLPFSS